MMSRTVLLVAMAAAAQLGCQGVEEQNYRILEESEPMFAPEPYSGTPALGILAAVMAVPSPAPENGQVLQETAAPANPQVVFETIEQAALEDPRSEHEISVQGVDRSNWPTLVVSPESGIVEHGPIYFEDLEPFDERGGLGDRSQELETRFSNVLSGDTSDPLAGGSRLETLTQPVKFGFDLLTLPINVFRQPPWSTQTSPQDTGSLSRSSAR